MCINKLTSSFIEEVMRFPNTKSVTLLVVLLMGLGMAQSGRTYLDLLQYKNYVFADADSVCSNFTSSNNVSQGCSEQLQILCDNPNLLMTVLDASSKFPYSGLGYASKMDHGNFDQCLSVDYKYEGGRILGEYCTMGLVIIDIFANVSDPNDFYKLAVCKPNGCSANDLNSIVKQLGVQDFPGMFTDTTCQTVETYSTFTAADIVTLAIFAVILLLMALSTIYDVYLYQNQQKCPFPLLLAFSVLSNGRKLLHISKRSSKEQIETFHGLRVISMMWVVIGHEMAMFPYLSISNIKRVNDWQNHMYAFYITAAHLAVDTFFFMSGFLLAFQYLKGRTRSLKEQILSVPYMIVHRYLRLTPAMLMTYLVTISIMIHLGSGPLWSLFIDGFGIQCRNHWMPFFLYIQNYYNYDDMCLLHTWYLSADMQLFLVSPLVLIPLSLQLKKCGLKTVMAELFVFNLFWTILPLVMKLVFRDYGNDYDTHSRFVNYFIGVMLGVFMRSNIDKSFLHMVKETNRDVTNLVTWPTILVSMLAIVLGKQAVEMGGDYVTISVFYSLMRPAWCIGLSWIVYSCYHGHGGFVNWILCRPIFQVIGRLTYCTYLLHVSVIAYYQGSARTRWYFSDYNAVYQFCGHYVVSLILATFWTLAFESPLIIIEKHLVGGTAKTTSKTDVTQDVNTISRCVFIVEGSDVIYRDFKFASADVVCNYFSTAGVDEKCVEQLEVVCQNVSLIETILDASSKFPYAGLGYGSKLDYGNFDQCLSIDYKYEGDRILGEYCIVGLAIPNIFGNLSNSNEYYKLAMCRPNGCSANDYNAILKQLVNLNISLGLFSDIGCQTVETYSSLSTTDIVTSTIIGVVVLLMVLSTIYDVYLHTNELKCTTPLLVAFSVFSNGRRLLHVSEHPSKEQIQTFHGLRVISMMWVIIGHELSLFPLISVSNSGKVNNWQNQLYAFYITAAHLAVDTFFYMSGFLLAFQYLKGRTRSLTEQILSIPRMVIHRLTPAMLMTYLVVISISIHFGSGPLWPFLIANTAETCRKRWLPFFLYIQNYYNYEAMCIVPTWYLSADMQMFLVSPLVLIPLSLQLKRWGCKKTMIELFVMNLVLTVLPLVIKLVFRDYDNEYDTHSRFVNYFIGVMFGAFMRMNIDKPFLYMVKEKDRSIVNLLMWPIILASMLAIVLGKQGVEMGGDYVTISVFYSLMRPVWCICLSWIVYSCHHGRGGFVNWILSAPIFQVIGRLTYCAYLLHVLVIAYYQATARTRWYFSDYNAIYQFWGHYIVSLIVATFWTLAFELPLISIEKFLIGGPARATNENKATQKDSTGVYMLAVCRPNGCTAQDYNAMLSNTVDLPIYAQSLFQDISCQTIETNTKYKTEDIVTLTIFSIVIALMIFSTLYDVFLYKTGSKPFHPLMISFSVLSNGRKLLHISRHSTSKEQIEIFHGIRVISMIWIVSGHGFVMWQYGFVINAEKVDAWQKQMYAVYITAGPFAVDTFFFMSGFLLAFQYFKGKTKSLAQQLLAVPRNIIHRYLRLTPAMLMIYLVTISIFMHMGSGPAWNLMNQGTVDVCKKHWARFFFYIQNYYDDFQQICLIQTWYLSADMQLFLIAPIFLIPLSIQLKKMGFKIVMVELLILNIIWTFLPIILKLNYKQFNLKHPFDTHSRLINYFIGIMLGLFMRVKIDKPFLYIIKEGLRPIVSLATWIVILLGMTATFICYRDEELHHGYDSQTVYNALMRPAWCIGMSWITYSSYHGEGGFIGWILSRPIFQVVGRLTYCIYLVHMTVISYYVGTMRNKLYFSDYIAFYQNTGHYVVSVIVAVFWTLAFESPLIIVEKYLLGGAQKPKETKEQQATANGEHHIEAA
ncbi:hypothetical protein NQ315_007606 [Exocentrus adspersus]|uniref:Nose resistant-to-fluoxetine protein N-terminal domain-containing protein n=1 Tax=Exocentrus adspersus TaxID=1586481 RepID=A0AAV8W7M6_9CUCU|nr:hypothetical protein NQ315_007606 [Exocentrus adspersus]